MQRMTIHIVGLFLTWYCLVTTGCYSRLPDNKTLLYVEHIMHDHPDSALAILQHMDTSSLHSASNAALYALLRVQAEDKNFIDSQDESTIRIAVDYFKNGEDDFHKMLSYYYLARIEENRKDYSKAILSLSQAEKTCKKVGSRYYLGMIYRSFSDIYNNVFNNKESLDYAKKAYESFAAMGDNRYADWGLCDLAKEYHNCMNYDSSIVIAQRVVRTATQKKDTALLAFAFRTIATSYVAKNDYRNARSMYWKLRELGEKHLSISDYRHLGVTYFNTGNIDSAILCMDIIESADSTQRWLSYQLNKRRGKYKEALSALERELESQNEVVRDIIRQNVTSVISEYRTQEYLRQENDIKRERRIRFILLTVFLIILCLTIVIMCQHIRHQKNKIDSNMLLASNLHQMLHINETEILALKDSIDKQSEEQKIETSALHIAINQLFEQKFSSIDKLCNTYYECQGTELEKHKIYHDVIHQIESFRTNKKTLEELEAYINSYKDNLMQHFRADFPDMKKSDLLLFLYSVAGFSCRAISIFIGEKLEVVYNRKSRLKQKIKHSSSPLKKEYTDSLH